MTMHTALAPSPGAPSRTSGYDIRPIEPADAERLERMFHRLSTDTVYRRFFTLFDQPRPASLTHLATVDHGRREAVVAVVDDEVIGVARYDRFAADPARAEIAVTVEDAWQRKGVASTLLGELAALARQRGISTFVATILWENKPAIRLMRSLDPDATVRHGQGEVEMELSLPPGT